MINVATFVANENIPDGYLWARHNKTVVWFGTASAAPLDHFPIGTRCHVHPDYYKRLEAAVSKVEKGVPCGPEEPSAP